MRRFILVVGASLPAAILLPSSALSQQEGSLVYAPEITADSVMAVPLGSPLLLVALALLVVLLAVRVLHRHPHWRTFCLLAAIMLAGVTQLPGVIADRVDVALNDPSGGTVPVPVGPQRYVNETQIALKVTSLQPPCPGGVDFASVACAAQTTRLASGEFCETDFVCPSPEVCDGLDNDLNNLVDDAVTPPKSLCETGNWVCTGLTGWACEACVPDCSGRACGSDGCGGSCGTCGGGDTCSESGLCVGP